MVGATKTAMRVGSNHVRADDEFSGQCQVDSADSGHCEKGLPARFWLVHMGVSLSHGID